MEEIIFDATTRTAAMDHVNGFVNWLMPDLLEGGRGYAAVLINIASVLLARWETSDASLRKYFSLPWIN